LLFCGPWRTLLTGTTAILLLAVAWPVATWGMAGSIQIYSGWLEQLNILTNPQFQAGLATTPIITLARATMVVTGEGPLGTATRAVVAAMYMIWIAAILWYFRQAYRSPPVTAPSRAALADWTVLLLAPLPFSPVLEPGHAIPILLGAILLVLVTLDEHVSMRSRQIAMAGWVALAMTRIINVPFSMRGPLLLVQFVVVTVALGFLRPQLLALSEPRRATMLKTTSRPGVPHL
jgi:hypothetical protein